MIHILFYKQMVLHMRSIQSNNSKEKQKQTHRKNDTIIDAEMQLRRYRYKLKVKGREKSRSYVNLLEHTGLFIILGYFKEGFSGGREGKGTLMQSSVLSLQSLKKNFHGFVKFTIRFPLSQPKATVWLKRESHGFSHGRVKNFTKALNFMRLFCSYVLEKSRFLL